MKKAEERIKWGENLQNEISGDRNLSPAERDVLKGRIDELIDPLREAIGVSKLG